MRKWILLAIFNWLRKPANRQKAKNAWSKYRGGSRTRTSPQRPQSRSTPARHSDEFDNRR
ncbi:hypothetical protein B0H98_102210 [Vreelandella songnenensis]|uniref:Uncharacterized protein n=1 Tax=Vreelandella songnenensis TaxID=1176243 RepID=A0A2T0V6A2_9GAMM|nr:hypothetical protein [Halomonas songnenensis]PRY65681.1 hypothetical protein B0H98_102210 [Halomonas songnenensis]